MEYVSGDPSFCGVIADSLAGCFTLLARHQLAVGTPHPSQSGSKYLVLNVGFLGFKILPKTFGNLNNSVLISLDLLVPSCIVRE